MSNLKKIFVVKTAHRILGFKTLSSQMVFGQKNLQQRLIQQLEKRHCFFQWISSEDPLPEKNNLILYDNILYSEKVLDFLLKSHLKENFSIETTLNPSIVFDEIQKTSFDLGLMGPSQSIPQQETYSVHIGLPTAVYDKKNCRVPFPDLFVQPLREWPDILNVASLWGREMTIQNYNNFYPWLGKKILHRLFNSDRVGTFFNKIGKNCRIHPTAILESSVLGDNVEIGPHCYIRASHIGSHVVLREKSSVKLSSIGNGSFVMPCDLFNTYVGERSSIFTSIVHNTVIGNETFIGGGVGFSDSNAEKSAIQIAQNGSNEKTGQYFLGSCVAENCFIGAGLLFQSGRLIPSGAHIINGSMIYKSDFVENKTYVAHQGRIVQMPKDFLR